LGNKNKNKKMEIVCGYHSVECPTRMCCEQGGIRLTPVNLRREPACIVIIIKMKSILLLLLLLYLLLVVLYILVVKVGGSGCLKKSILERVLLFVEKFPE